MWARLFLYATAAVFVGFGLWGLVAPAQVLSTFDVAQALGEARTAIRTIYGGSLTGIGLLFAFCAADAGRVRVGLQAVLLISGAILGARLVGFAVDGSASAYHLAYAALELIGIMASAGFLITGAATARGRS
jgi:hypothetical protein